MSKQNLSGCFTDKQLDQLNDRLHTLGFEFGCVLDEALAKVLVAPPIFEICDATDIPPDTGGVQQLICIVDGECTYVDKTTINNETNTTLTLDPVTCVLTFTNENGDNPPIDLTNIDICKFEPFKSLPALTNGVMSIVSDGLGGVTKQFEEKEDWIKDCLMTVKCEKLYDANGVEFIRKAVYDFDGLLVGTPEDLLLDLSTAHTPANPVSCEPPKKLYPILASETVSFDDVTSGTLTIPAGAIGASLVIDSSPSCEARFTINGTIPSATNGYEVYDCAQFDLGCTENSAGEDTELSNFEIIGIDGCSGDVQVIYY